MSAEIRRQDALELSACLGIVRSSSPEVPVERMGDWPWSKTILMLAEGFEDRSLGLLKWLAHNELKAAQVILGRYGDSPELNARHRASFRSLCRQVSVRPHLVRDLKQLPHTLVETRASLGNLASKVVLDISGLTGRAMFGALDCITAVDKDLALAYSEAKDYWPTKTAFDSILGSGGAGLEGDERQSRIEQEHWLHGGSHHVDLVEGHEGYDAGSKRAALLGFLPYKASRLGAVLGWTDYSQRVLVAGVPRLKANAWRRDALLRINEHIIGASQVVDLPTFGYLDVLQRLSTLLLSSDGLLERHNVHIAVLGSKLQNLACWLLSRTVASITVVTSSPAVYYPSAFSAGVGKSWIVPTVAWNGCGARK